MEIKQATRFDRALATFFSQYPDHTYSQCQVPSNPDIAFRLLERIRPPGPNGRFKTLGEITYGQAEVIATTSRSDAEIVERLRMLLIDGIDTTTPVASTNNGKTAPLYSEDDVRRIVRAAIEEVQNRNGTGGPVQIQMPDIHVPDVPRETPEPVAQNRDGKRKHKNVVAADTYSHDVWCERSDRLQIPHPKRMSDGTVHDNWLRFAVLRWAKHIATGDAV